MSLTRRHLCDDWQFQHELEREGKHTPKYNQTVKEREQKMQANPNHLECFGHYGIDCNTFLCPHYNLCESADRKADGVVAIEWEESNG